MVRAAKGILDSLGTVSYTHLMEYLSDVGVDAVILADVGVLSQAKKYAPNVECHISTQASIVNYISAQAWYDLGAKRIILARELSLDEIREIRAKAPKEL